MEFNDVKESRRAYRVIKPVNIDESITDYLSRACQLAPSCYNNQPWNYVFVKSPEKLVEMRDTLSKGNEWAYDGSLIIAVFSEPESDCIVAKREYYLFDTGISAGFLILAATDLGLVAHPIAGYSESKVKKVLNIPDKFRVITLIIVGKQDKEKLANLPEEKLEDELTRPERKPYDRFISFDEYRK